MRIESKRSLKYLLISAISILFIFALATVMLFIFRNEVVEKGIKNKTYLLILSAILAFALGINLVYTYLKYSRKIIVDKEKISFNGQYYEWKNIKEITLTGKKSFGILNSPLEATTITFLDNSRHFIFDDIYSNGAEIKAYIKNVIIDKKTDLISIENIITEKDIQNEMFYNYSGNPVFSFRGIMMWGFIIFILYLTFSTGGKISFSKKLIVFIPVCIVWFLINAYSMNYFQVSKNFLVIKNHYFFWKKNIFKLTDIEELVIETQPKQANMLRVITKDFKRKLYRAGTLKDSTWHDLKDDLEKKNVIVRNEFI